MPEARNGLAHSPDDAGAHSHVLLLPMLVMPARQTATRRCYPLCLLNLSLLARCGGNKLIATPHPVFDIVVAIPGIGERCLLSRGGIIRLIRIIQIVWYLVPVGPAFHRASPCFSRFPPNALALRPRSRIQRKIEIEHIDSWLAK